MGQAKKVFKLLRKEYPLGTCFVLAQLLVLCIEYEGCGFQMCLFLMQVRAIDGSSTQGTGLSGGRCCEGLKLHN